MSNDGPTGLSRYRSQHRGFFRRREELVLQIEMRGLRASMVGGWITSDYTKWWRDATSEDISVMKSSCGSPVPVV